MSEMITVSSIADAHAAMGLTKPKHPLVSTFMHRDIRMQEGTEGVKARMDLYQISLKEGVEGAFGYGRNSYDFSEGTMVFVKAGQVITGTSYEVASTSNAWGLLFHPDLIRKSSLGSTIGNYSFFDYEISEALHLSEEEMRIITEIRDKIERECDQNIDKHSQNLIVSNIELILNYCVRYYDRQFYTRSNWNKDTVSQLDALLKKYYLDQKQLEIGTPTVSHCAAELGFSTDYLSDMLKKEIGRSAQEHIHHFIIERAKNDLLGSTASISEIAYGLGFNYPQHFSKLFKNRTGLTPVEYRSTEQ